MTTESAGILTDAWQQIERTFFLLNENVGDPEQCFKIVQNHVTRKSYAIRRIRDAFKANKNLNDCDAIEAAYNEAFSTLAIIKRQVVISDLYKCDKLVIEKFRVSAE